MSNVELVVSGKDKEGIQQVDDLEQTNGPDKQRTESIYRLIIVAGLRTKQLQRGSTPRIEANVLKRKYTSIAREEVRRGLVRYTPRTAANGSKQHKVINADAHSAAPSLSGV